MSRFLYSNAKTDATPREPGSMPDVYIGNRSAMHRSLGNHAIVEQQYEMNSRLARIEALLERIAAAAEYVPPAP